MTDPDRAPRVGIITQARSASTRLPRKILLHVGGKTLLEHHLDRLATSGLPVYVATTTSPADDEIALLARARGVSAHRGSETDVLARFHDCATEHGLDVVVRVTSDCPLIDGRVLADGVATFLTAHDPDLYLSNTRHRSFPRGFDFEVFTAAALARAHANATTPTEREHVTPYLYTGGATTLRSVTWPVDASRYRVTLDTPEDLQVIRTLIEDHHADHLTCAQIIDLLQAHPEITAINAAVEQKKLGE